MPITASSRISITLAHYACAVCRNSSPFCDRARLKPLHARTFHREPGSETAGMNGKYEYSKELKIGLVVRSPTKVILNFR
jgi:hypothetical protein